LDLNETVPIIREKNAVSALLGAFSTILPQSLKTHQRANYIWLAEVTTSPGISKNRLQTV